MTDLSCPYCQAPLRPEAKFCSSCGKSLPVNAVAPPPPPPSICPACGKPSSAGARFCTSCGKALILGVQPAPPQPIPVHQVSSSAHPASPKRRSVGLGWIIAGVGGCLTLAVIAIGAIILLPGLLDGAQPAHTLDPVRTPRPTRTHVNTLTPTFTPSPTITPTVPPTPTTTPTSRPMGKPVVHALAPDFSLIDANSGDMVTLSQFAGQPVMINFWATWCGYCEEEMPSIQSAYVQRQADGLIILAVDVEETRDQVTDYGLSHGLTFNLLLDENGEVDALYKIEGYPTSIFIDRDGIIQYIYLGEIEPEVLNQYLDEIMLP